MLILQSGNCKDFMPAVYRHKISQFTKTVIFGQDSQRIVKVAASLRIILEYHNPAKNHSETANA